MGKVEYLVILVKEHNKPVYFPGEMISGIVRLKVTERLKINCVQLTIKGQGHTYWTETTGDSKNRRTHTRSANETYLNYESMLVPKSDIGDLFIEPGEYEYPFELQLPANLPSSFSGKDGYITYSVNANIDIPWAFDKHAEFAFSVVDILDLNKLPDLRTPKTATEKKTVGCLCWKGGDILMEFSLPKTGFVPGESVNFNLDINNRSSREIKKVVIGLIQEIYFRADGHVKGYSNSFANMTLPIVIKPSSNYESAVPIAIPPICSSMLPGGMCKLIEIQYFARIEIKTTGISTTKYLRIPIVIGNLPFQSSQDLPFRPYTFETCTISKEAASDGIKSGEKGELLGSNLNTYKPVYPFYENLNANN